MPTPTATAILILDHFTPLEARAKGAADATGVLPLTGFTSRGEEFDYEYYKKLAGDPKVVAVGECGLDYFHMAGDKERAAKQKRAFEEQIELAREIKKPLMIHCRDGKKSGTGQAFDDLVDILKTNAAAAPFISHSFVRDIGLAKKLLDLGSYFSFNGIITFTHDYDEVVRFLPVDRILSETDAPYLAPVPYRGKPRHQIEHCNAQTFSSVNRPDSQSHSFIVGPSKEAGVVENEVLGSVRGKRNEPAYVVEVVKKLAELKGLSVGKMSEQIWENAKRIFLI